MVMIPQNYIGCDVSKDKLDFFDPQRGGFRQIRNMPKEIGSFVAGLDGSCDFVVMEATGHHDRLLRHALAGAGIGFARRNPMQMRRFAQAEGQRAKSDGIDARMLSRYGERYRPQPDPLPSRERERVAALSRRRDQLVETRAREKRHLGEAFEDDIIADIKGVIDELSARIDALEKVIAQAVRNADSGTARDYEILVSAPGISLITATALIAHLPELGHRTPKTIASLVGLAPFNNDSGKRNGRRAIAGGRGRVRRALYMASLSAKARCPRFAAFYQRILARSGCRKLAIVAVARKLLTVLNAMLRDQVRFNASPEPEAAAALAPRN
ncbi:MAG TPA: IS110 family transposase [Pseudorhizobium sp.]|nr:IS110 family transposase [Pseudorhizobium sp.]